MSKFKVGDKVRIINYGCAMWEIEDGETKFFDMMPEIVGKTGIIDGVLNGKYSLAGNRIKSSWYSEEQLELIL